jgi:5-(carboxyamino)imidazole ribonucleotide mutase
LEEQLRAQASDANDLLSVMNGMRETLSQQQHAISKLVAKRARAADRAKFAEERCEEAEARGVNVIIAGAGGAAHLPGMVAAHTVIPVLGVPIQSSALNGMDSLLSIVQMPAGIPVGTLAIGDAGAKNAALLAIAILGVSNPELREKLQAFREEQTDKVLQTALAT